MKKLISIMTSLLIAVVGNYSQAQDTRITTPKATNGALDPNVTVIKDEGKKPKEKVRVTVEDFQDFSEKTLDDRVVEFRRGNEYYTMIPFSDLWFTPTRKEAFEVAQTFGDKLMKVWLLKTLNMRYEGATEELNREMAKLTSDQLRALLQKGNNGSTMPTAREIVEASNDAKDAVQRLKERSKFHVEFDELISSFDKHQEEIFALRGLSSVQSKIVPKALTFALNFKVPGNILEKMKSSKLGASAAFLLQGSITFTVTVRPWKVVKTNLDTGVRTESWYLESATQTWILKDFKSNKAAVTGPLRLGVGLLWGDFDRMADINGAVTGYTKNFGFSKSSLNDTLPIPSHTSIQVGTINAVVETLTQGLDLANFIKNGYFIVSRQYGYVAPPGTATGSWDVGGIFNLASLTDRVALNQDTLEDLLKVVATEIPGAEVIVNEDQVQILIPQEDAPTEVEAPIIPKKQ